MKIKKTKTLVSIIAVLSSLSLTPQLNELDEIKFINSNNYETIPTQILEPEYPIPNFTNPSSKNTDEKSNDSNIKLNYKSKKTIYTNLIQTQTSMPEIKFKQNFENLQPQITYNKQDFEIFLNRFYSPLNMSLSNSNIIYTKSSKKINLDNIPTFGLLNYPLENKLFDKSVFTFQKIFKSKNNSWIAIQASHENKDDNEIMFGLILRF